VLQVSINSSLYDAVIPVAGAEGIEWAKALAQREGILTGISGGASFAVAHQIAEQAPAGSVILCMLAETGERYMTLPLFDGIEAEMDEEERAVIPPFLTGLFGRIYAALANFRAGVMPPMPILGRSLL